MRQQFNDKCQVTCTDNDKTVTADVMSYRHRQMLTVLLGESKVGLKWNGRSVYVGNAIGMEFTSKGPEEIVKMQGRGHA
ncbi:MAG: hypothetical protein CMA64_07040 [Euryarchaeota archaeon]|nr:hypothetical protein [Euryarchaeota archaeon]|tara:strand:- start:12 stop:248 length:237 start_codon:yes stop_codon:yes gene_type:complete